MAIFAERFSQLRKDAGLTQETAAAKLGISKGTVGNYESGTRFPRIDDLENIADFFNVSIDYLVGKTNKAPEYTLEEQWIIKCYRRADQPIKDGIRQILWAFDEKNNPVSSEVSA